MKFTYFVNYLISKGFFNCLSDKYFLPILYYTEMGEWPNLKEPHKLSEKLQWLKLNYRRADLAVFSDKVKVKDYIAKTIGPEYIIPTLGVWERAEDVDFSKLPDKFVIKVNHNSGLGMYICTDKSKMNEEEVRKGLAKGLREDYYIHYREWSYKNIPRRIIAEQFIENADGSPIVDYKFYCYGGKPRYFMYSVGEANHHVRNCKFDMDCHNIDYLFKKKPTLSNEEIKLPANFEEMKNIVEKLCIGFPHVRVDLYNVDGKIYFGELTFYSGAGFIRIDNEDYSNELANYIELQKISEKHD
jgi:hypothetical protein